MGEGTGEGVGSRYGEAGEAYRSVGDVVGPGVVQVFGVDHSFCAS